jgi:hypothetical protein
MAASSKNLRKNEREKARRNEINDQFQQLSEVLGTPTSGQIPRREKQNLLAAACRTITDLRNQKEQLLNWHSALNHVSSNPPLVLALQQLLPSAPASQPNDEDASRASLGEEKEPDRTLEPLTNSPAQMGLSLTLSPVSQQFPNPFTDLEALPWSSEEAIASMNQFTLRSPQQLISSGQESEAKMDSENMADAAAQQPQPQGRKRKRSRSAHDE